jgi:hypothetical protein
MGECAAVGPLVVVVDVPDTAEARSGSDALGVLTTPYPRCKEHVNSNLAITQRR